MKAFYKVFTLLLICSGVSLAFADNQTVDTSTIQSQAGLPFSITIQQANFLLPVGLHSGVVGEFNGLWVFIAGRMNGLHGFGADPFPPDQQNTSIYVVNPRTGQSFSRSLKDPSSGLTPQQIEMLSVVSPEGFQEGNTLYMVGGYGVDANSTTYSTKPVLTAINLPGIIKWVTEPGNRNYSVAKNIRQLFDPIFQITGGRLYKVGSTFQLVFGQNFEGVYTPSSNGDYSRQVRQFKLVTNGGKFSFIAYPSKPQTADPSYRRRDLNVLPALLNKNNLLDFGLVAYSGVFTLTGGVWTVPVVMDSTGNPVMANPLLPNTFKQGMNQYICAAASLYSQKYSSNYHIFFGGASYGYYSGGTFQTDSEIPFINQVTTVRMDSNGNFTQYLMNNEYPVIISTGSNPGNTLLFGAGAYFIPKNIPQYQNREISLDSIRQPTVIGYIVGGIQSTLPNTNTQSDSAASPYVFTVSLTPTGKK